MSSWKSHHLETDMLLEFMSHRNIREALSRTVRIVALQIVFLLIHKNSDYK